MRVLLNGVENNVEEDISVIDLLNQNSLPADATVVEINGSIIDPSRFADEKILENDAIEVLRFVGGG